jgi:uncharacterized protein (TIGR03435 family)
LLILGIVCVTFRGIVAQTTTSQPAFEAASVKPSKTGGDSSSWNSRLGYIVMKNQTLQRLVAIAYGFSDEQRVLGGPKWVASDRFDIEARASGPAKDPELLLMLRNLLADRFELAVHQETKNGSGYSLTTVKGGLKIHPDESEGKQVWNSSRGKIVAQRITMSKLAEALTRLLGTSVADNTNVQGQYTFSLEWSLDAQNSAASDRGIASMPAGPSLEDVLAQQLGLKLENKKLPIDVVVIDRAEKPTEN